MGGGGMGMNMGMNMGGMDTMGSMGGLNMGPP